MKCLIYTMKCLTCIDFDFQMKISLSFTESSFLNSLTFKGKSIYSIEKDDLHHQTHQIFIFEESLDPSLILLDQCPSVVLVTLHVHLQKKKLSLEMKFFELSVSWAFLFHIWTQKYAILTWTSCFLDIVSNTLQRNVPPGKVSGKAVQPQRRDLWVVFELSWELLRDRKSEQWTALSSPPPLSSLRPRHHWKV